MTGLPLTSNAAGRAGFINPNSTGVSGRTVTQIGLSDSASGVQGGVLVGEFKRLATFAGQTVADDTIHVTIRDDSEDSYTLRAFCLYLDNGDILSWHVQDEPIMEKASKAMLLMSADMQLTGLNVTELQFGDANWTNPVATTQVFGVLRIASDAAAIAGTSNSDAVTPSGLKAVLNDRLGAAAPSTFVKSLLGIATAQLLRIALELGNAATRNMGAGNGLDADMLDGQHGTYYSNYANLSNVPTTFTPSAHSHAWGDISGVPSTASRWPDFSEVTGKPATYPPSSHVHAWADIVSGVPETATRWPSWTEVSSKPASFPPSAHSHAEYVIRAGDSGINVLSAGGGATLAFRDSINSVNRFYFNHDNTSWSINECDDSSSYTGTSIRIIRSTHNVEFGASISAVGGYDFGSSRKLKDIDGPVPYGLAAVERMELAAGCYKPGYNKDGRRRLFFVAEQLAELVPEAVDMEGVEFNGERVPSIKLDQLLPVMAKAIQELAAEVSALKASR